MQLASHGARALARRAPPTARSIHISSALRPHLAQRVLSQTRLALTRFVTHLTAPGVGSPVSVARSFHVNPTIQQRLSFTARTTLARPLQPTFLPRAPVVPRTMAQVGLGTARNFSSGRPIFQHLAENIPIAGRAFYEADWDAHMRQEMENMTRPSKKRASKKQASKELSKPTEKLLAPAHAPSTSESEMEHYFPASSVPGVTTYMLIPLAPTPTERAPLPEFPSGRLPLAALLEIHDSHETHSLRVSSLFQRLDAADVWSRGAFCSGYASSVGPRGVCTILKVEFVGWSKAAVRGIIGESGTGWCVLEETIGATGLENSFDDGELSDTSSILSDIGPEDPVPSPAAGVKNLTSSFVFPTLDFSSTFLGASGADARSPAASGRSGTDFFAHSNSSGSDLGAWSDDASSVAFVDPPSENGWFETCSRNPWLETPSSLENSWLGFSSEFSQRQAHARTVTPEPLESAFA